MPLRIARPFLLCLLSVAIGATVTAQSPPSQPSAPASGIAGVWVLNPALTQRPEEVGFSPDWVRTGGEEGGRTSGGRGRRGGSGGGSSAAAPYFGRESVEDSTRVQQLTGEARTPPAHLSIVQKETSVSIADDQGHSRTFHPDGKLEELTLGNVALPTTARWSAGGLVVLYEVESGRQIRYTYTPSANPARLLVDIRFIEHGREGDEVRLTYEPPGEHERSVISTPPAASATPSAAPPTSASAPAPGSAPPARPPVLPPGSELRGITTIGTQVEDLTAQAAVCGLDQAKVKTAVAGILSAAGFKAQPYGNEETYVLVSVVTSRLADGTCISRYDASLMAQADATLPYAKGLVMLEVPLIHEGGMAGGSPAVHAKAVMDALTTSVNRFVAQIRASK